jgi:hypothetical protein
MKHNNKDAKWGFKDFITDKTLYITLVISALITIFSNADYLRSVIVAAGSAMVEMSGALLGIVLAGLAIFIVFLDKKYIALIEKFYKIGDEFFPIKTVVILSIFCLAFGLGLIILGKPPDVILRIVFGVALWNFSYLLWQIYELVKWLLGHAKARAMQIRKEDEDAQKEK